MSPLPSSDSCPDLGTRGTAETRLWAPGCRPALSGNDSRQQLGRNLKSMICLGDFSAYLFKVGDWRAQTLIRRSPLPSLGAHLSPSHRAADFLIFLPHHPRQETRSPSPLFPPLHPRWWPFHGAAATGDPRAGRVGICFWTCVGIPRTRGRSCPRPTLPFRLSAPASLILNLDSRNTACRASVTRCCVGRVASANSLPGNLASLQVPSAALIAPSLHPLPPRGL